jgi:hypothetical protein
MKVALLILALALMLTAIVTSSWVDSPSLPFTHNYARFWVKGRVTGDFPDKPWAGTVAYLGGEKSTLNEEGTFQFSRSPGTYILKICCSDRFRWIYREVLITDRDVHLDLVAQPIVDVPGRVIILDDSVRRSNLKISAWLVGTNVLEAAVTLSDGSFTLHLVEGRWQVDVDNAPKGHDVEWVTFGDEKVASRTFTIVGKTSPSLPLQIALR